MTIRDHSSTPVPTGWTFGHCFDRPPEGDPAMTIRDDTPKETR
jgi:hypothetical protein